MIIRNCKIVSIITFGFAKGITLWPFILFKGEPNLFDIAHEKIHLEQQKELFVIGFYLWYLIEWAIKWSYHDISFEREAYQNQWYAKYLLNRKHFSFTKYI